MRKTHPCLPGADVLLTKTGLEVNNLRTAIDVVITREVIAGGVNVPWNRRPGGAELGLLAPV